MQSNSQNTNDTNNNINSRINGRRGFVKGLGVGLGAIATGVAMPSRAELVDFSGGSFSNNGSTNLAYGSEADYSEPDYDEANWGESYQYYEPPKPVVSCVPPVIATRLFSSSNTSSGMYERNKLATDRLTCAGFDVQNPEVLERKYYRFGGTDSQRAADFEDIATGRVPAPKLLLGVRGGYGAMRILDKVNWAKLGSVLRERGTIVGGFSDVTAIQCALLAKGNMSSANLPMAYSEFGKTTPDPVSVAGFVKAVTDKNLTLSSYDGGRTSYKLPAIISNRPNQRISGTIWGGNLSVLSSIAGSDYMPNPNGGIVFIEEVGEAPYRIERMLYDMHLAGAFDNQQAIVFGAISKADADAYDPSYDVAAVINELHRITGLPIYNGVAFGHVSKKQSFPMGCHCEIVPNGSGFNLQFSGYPTIEAGLINEAALAMSQY